MVTNLRQEELHAFGILVINDVYQLRQLFTYLRNLSRSIRIEKDFLQEIIILIQHTLGYLHVALEGSTRCILMLHHSRKGKGADKRNTQRVSHRLVVLVESIFMQTQSQLLIQVLEEDLAHVVALLDDDRILL